MKADSAIRETIPFAQQGAPFRITYYQNMIFPSVGLFGYHPEIEIQFVRRGSMIYTVRGRRYVLRPNSLLVIYPNEPHTSRPKHKGMAIEKITVMFKPTFADLPARKIIAGLGDCRLMRLNSGEAGALTRIALDLQAESHDRPADWMAMCRLKLMELVILVKRAASHPLQAEIGNPLVAQVLDLLDRRFAEPISNEALARAVGLSSSRLMHLFAEHMGQGIKQYILQLRILKACELLRTEPGLKVESIAQAVGFRYVADFNRAFKPHARLTPVEYRALRPNQLPHFPVHFDGRRSPGAARRPTPSP